MLKLKIKSLDEVDESQQSLYEKDGDEFSLQVEGLPDVGALKRAKDHEVELRKATNEKLSELTAKYQKLEAKISEGEDAGNREKGDVGALEKSWQDKFQKQEDAHKAKVKGLESNLQAILVDNKALEMAGSISVKGSESVLMPHIKSRLAVEERDGKFVTVVKDVNGNSSASTLEELQAEISSNASFAPIIAGSQANGGGASGGNGTGSSASLKRSGMSAKEKGDYVSEHGQDKFLQLPK